MEPHCDVEKIRTFSSSFRFRSIVGWSLCTAIFFSLLLLWRTRFRTRKRAERERAAAWERSRWVTSNDDKNARPLLKASPEAVVASISDRPTGVLDRTARESSAATGLKRLNFDRVAKGAPPPTDDDDAVVPFRTDENFAAVQSTGPPFLPPPPAADLTHFEESPLQLLPPTPSDGPAPPFATVTATATATPTTTPLAGIFNETPYTNPNDFPRAAAPDTQKKGRRLSFDRANSGERKKRRRREDGDDRNQDDDGNQEIIMQGPVVEYAEPVSGEERSKRRRTSVQEKTAEEYARIASVIRQRDDEVAESRRKMEAATGEQRRKREGTDTRRRKRGRVSFGGNTTKLYHPKDCPDTGGAPDEISAVDKPPSPTPFVAPTLTAFSIGPNPMVVRGIRERRRIVMKGRRVFPRKMRGPSAESQRKRVNEILENFINGTEDSGKKSSIVDGGSTAVPNGSVVPAPAAAQGPNAPPPTVPPITFNFGSAPPPAAAPVPPNFGSIPPPAAVSVPPAIPPTSVMFQIGNSAVGSKPTKSVGSEASRRRRAKKKK